MICTHLTCRQQILRHRSWLELSQLCFRGPAFMSNPSVNSGLLVGSAALGGALECLLRGSLFVKDDQEGPL